MCKANVHADDTGPLTPPLRWHAMGSCLAPGPETDGSGPCRSEHKAPELSSQSVVPVLNIDGSETLPRHRAGEGHRPPVSQAIFPFSSSPPSALISHLFPAMNLSSARASPSSCPVSPHLHTSPALSCVCDSITLVSSC